MAETVLWTKPDKSHVRLRNSSCFTPDFREEKNVMSTTCIPPARHIRTDDIPEEYRDIVDAIGMEAFIHLTLLCGGQTLYVPKRESLERGARDRDICALFNGSNYRSLAAQFRLSERQIRKIINGSRC